MRIFNKMYNILGLLEQAVAETDTEKRAKLYEQAKNTPVHDESSVAFRELFQMVFGTYPSSTEHDQICDTCAALVDRKSIIVSTKYIYGMEMAGNKTTFGETKFFRSIFGAGDKDINQEMLEKFKAEIGRAELTLGKIGDHFCLNYRDGEGYTFFWDRLIADNDQTQIRSLYLSNGALRQLATHRIGSRDFTYLTHDLRYLNEEQLSEIKMRSGKIDPVSVACRLYGEQPFSAEATELITTAIQLACNSQSHNCWSELLHAEFGQEESNAADRVLGGVMFEYPPDVLAKKTRDALYAVNDIFLKLRNNARHAHQQSITCNLSRPYAV